MTGDITDWGRLATEFNIPETYHQDHQAVLEAEQKEIDVGSALDERGERGDHRDLTTFTVDPPDAKDYDDALSIEETGDGYTAWVHIADVSHYVEPGSALEQAAEQRGVTFYLNDQTRHMLPEELSTDLCSLVPNEERLACTVEMDMDYEGNVEDFDIYKSVIESDERLSYDQADHYLEEGEWARQDRDPGVEADLEILDDLTAQMKADRWDDSLIINEKDSPSGRIIEEMMIQANSCVAEYCREENIPAMYRVEAYPTNGWREDVVEDLADLGYYRDPDWLAENHFEKLNEFMIHEVQEGDQAEARKAIVTKLPRARYETRAQNHFALNIQPYTHFTSPIRRAADLKNHQLIFGDEDEFSTEFRHEMEALATQISERQKEADEAQRAWGG